MEGENICLEMILHIARAFSCVSDTYKIMFVLNNRLCFVVRMYMH